MHDCLRYQKEHELSTADTYRLIKAVCLGIQPSREITDQEIADITGLSKSHSRDLRPFAAGIKVQEAAAPVISMCLKCGQLLTQIEPEKQKQPVFYRFGSPGIPGTLYVKHCSDCSLTYQLDGYQHSKDYLARGTTGHKLPYEAAHQHPTWFR